MNEQSRFKLHFGPYQAPRFRLGQVVICEARGRVRIVRISSGRIPWPVGQRGRAQSLVLCRGLVKAIKKEANIAVQYWWGVGHSAVRKWRRALGVGLGNHGSSVLRRASLLPRLARMHDLARVKARDPDRCEKIAASRRGKKRPWHVIDAMREGRLGKPHTEETKQKMREAHRKRRRPIEGMKTAN
jgi:hypothetical protein